MMRIVSVLALVALTACGTGAENPLLGAARGVLSGAKAGPKPSIEAQKAQVKSIVASSGDTSPVLLVVLTKQQAVASLVSIADNQGVQTWADASGVTVAARNGVVLSTRGLGFDVMASDVSGTMAALKSGGGTYQRTQRFLDGEYQLVPSTATCTAVRSGATMTETCSGPGGNYENSYTFSGDKLTASRQWLGEVIGYAEVSRLQ